MEDLFRKEKRTKISPDNAIPEFKQRFDMNSDDMEDLEAAVMEMTEIIEERIRSSFGDQNYKWAVAALGAVREEMVEMEMLKPYRDLLERLKRKVMAGNLGGDRKEFWYSVRNLGPINSVESKLSDLTPEDATAWMSAR